MKCILKESFHKSSQITHEICCISPCMSVNVEYFLKILGISAMNSTQYHEIFEICYTIYVEMINISKYKFGAIFQSLVTYTYMIRIGR